MGYIFHPDQAMRGKMLKDTREGKEGVLWPWSRGLASLPYMVLYDYKTMEIVGEPQDSPLSIEIVDIKECDEEETDTPQEDSAVSSVPDKKKPVEAKAKVHGK